MSSSKTIAVVIIILVVLGVWWYSGSSSSSGMPASAPTTADASATTSVPGGPSATDTSDAALQNDLNSVDASSNNVSTDAANADGGMNDAPIPQQ